MNKSLNPNMAQVETKKMTQLILNIDDASLIPSIKKLFSHMKGVSISQINEPVNDEKMLAKINESEAQFEAGKFKTIHTEDLWK
jgi:hypothetical protein